MTINKKYFKWLPTINGLLTVFSCICLYITFALFEGLHGEIPVKVQYEASCFGMVFCFIPILVWILRWTRLDKNYRQIAVLFLIVFAILLFMHVRNFLMNK